MLWEARAAQAARAYLAARGLGEEVCREFQLGFSMAGWANLRDAAAKKGFSERELIDAGLVVPGKKGGVYDRFRGRLMFPLSDERGRVLGFGARTLGDDKPKYLNSPRPRSTTKARPSLVSTAPRRAPPSSIACSWSRATPTSSPWCRPA